MNASVSSGGKAVLYDYWRSSAAYRVRIALELKAVPYERVVVDLTKGEQRNATYVDINPQSVVPALEIDGRFLTQSLAIIEYLDETRSGPPLLPADPLDRARVRAIALAVACDIHPVSNLKVLQNVEKMAGAAARAAWNRDNIAEGLAAIETLLDHAGFVGRFCAGESPTLADCALVPQIYNARRWGVDVDRLARIAAVERACAFQPAFRAAAPGRFDPASAAG